MTTAATTAFLSFFMASPVDFLPRTIRKAELRENDACINSRKCFLTVDNFLTLHDGPHAAIELMAVSLQRLNPEMIRPVGHSEVWIPPLARRNNLWVNLRQRLGALQLLWRSHHNWPGAIHHDPGTRLGAVAYKTRLFACRHNLRTGANPIRCRLSGRRLSGCRLCRCSLGLRRCSLSRLCQ